MESSNQVSDGDTIGRFRALLVEHGLQEQLFVQVLGLLQTRGLILKIGVVKGFFGYRKTSYKGRQKQTTKLHMVFALANLYLADKRGLLA